MTTRRSLIIAVMAAASIAVAGCGASTNPQAHAAAVNYCSSDGDATRSSCECAVTGLENAGYSDSKLLVEMKDATAMLSDTKLIRISLLCAGH